MNAADMMTRIWTIQAQFRNGDIDLEGVVEAVADIAFESGVPGEPEQFITCLAFELITGERFEEDKYC